LKGQLNKETKTQEEGTNNKKPTNKMGLTKGTNQIKGLSKGTNNQIKGLTK
jgi:hypothetical protein